jgi:hypothetical protein
MSNHQCVNKFSVEPVGVATGVVPVDIGSACCCTNSNEGWTMSLCSMVDRSISGLERDLANRKKSSSMLEARLLLMEVTDGRVTWTVGVAPSTVSLFC